MYICTYFIRIIIINLLYINMFIKNITIFPKTYLVRGMTLFCTSATLFKFGLEDSYEGLSPLSVGLSSKCLVPYEALPILKSHLLSFPHCSFQSFSQVSCPHASEPGKSLPGKIPLTLQDSAQGTFSHEHCSPYASMLVLITWYCIFHLSVSPLDSEFLMDRNCVLYRNLYT